MSDRATGPSEREGAAFETILITGGAGFVGSNLVAHLAQHGHKVIPYSRTVPPAIVQRFWQPVQTRIVFEAGSVTDARHLDEVMQHHQPSVIIHAAAVTAVDSVTEARKAREILEVNLISTVTILELARRFHVRRLVYVSSAGIYGASDPQLPVPETAPLQVKGLYLIAKETSERLCNRWRELFGLDLVIIRLGQPYGPMERDTGVRTILSPTYQLARAGMTRGVVRVPEPDYSCDWTYTVDVGEAFRLLTEAEVLEHHAYNVSNGQSRRLSDVVAQLEELIPGAHFEWIPADGPADIDTRSDPRRGPLDISRLRHGVGFEPAYDLARGLRAALPWWREMAQATG